MTYFVNGEHEAKYDEFLQEANVGEKEYTVQSVLYLLSSVPKIAKNIEQFFVLKGKYINPDEAERMELSTGERIIVGLAFNLYNGYEMEGVDLSPHTVLSWLDKNLKNAYVQALGIKMGTNQSVA
ncbi:hypothetical protein CVD28_03895 [Bacillus sp. M6-12]|uniref:DUF6075 family protein n=1 Tax=Bacillus sp. M6-12 TaxID=2054166 RepID=UPI000C7893E0|nr:DUF6075 family protein [Bacillus sp. M6-12]PLS19570.1 hypothetical protein CVD28_03895 [Bacillus sp. M6-12]